MIQEYEFPITQKSRWLPCCIMSPEELPEPVTEKLINSFLYIYEIHTVRVREMTNERNWIPVSIPKPLYEKVQAEYEKKGFSNASQLVQYAIRKFLEKEA